MLRVLLTRGILFLLPFAAWLVWRAWAKRTGREMGSTPFAWLFAAGAMLIGLSLLASGAFHGDTRNVRYVPGEATSSGAVTPGRFVPAPGPPR